jgi:hypothetical protein
MVLSTFTTSAKPSSYITVTGTNQIRTWDAVGVKEPDESAIFPNLLTQFTEKDHLKLKYTAISHGSCTSKKRKLNDDFSALLGLGTVDGSVTLFDVARGKKIKRLKPESTGRPGEVTSLSFSPDCKHCWSCALDGQISKWSVSSGDLKKRFSFSDHEDPHYPTALAVSPCGTFVAVASSRVRLFDASTFTLIREYVGHSAQVAILRWSADSQFFVTGAKDNGVSIWKAQGKKTMQVQPTRQLHIEIRPVSLSICRVEERNYAVMATAEGGCKAYCWYFSTKLKRKERTVPVLPSSTIRIDTNQNIVKPSGGPIIDVQFFGSPFHAVLARGPLLRPTFATLSLKAPKDENETLLKEILLEELKPVRTTSAKKSKSLIPKNLNENVIAVSDFPLPGYDATVEKNHKGSRKRSLSMDVKKENGASIQSKSGDTERLSKRARLEAKGIGNGSTLLDAVVCKRKEVEETITSKDEEQVVEEEATEGAEETVKLPSRGRSIHIVLEQALQSQDVKMLEVCLTTNEETIKLTVRRLTEESVVSLMEKLVQLFRKQHRRAKSLSLWIKHLLHAHAIALSGNPSLHNLAQALEYRIQWATPLMKLQGRLDFVSSMRLAKAVKLEEPTPLNTYSSDNEI